MEAKFRLKESQTNFRVVTTRPSEGYACFSRNDVSKGWKAVSLCKGICPEDLMDLHVSSFASAWHVW